MSQLYLRFLRIAREVDIQKTPVKNIDSTALLLLNEIAVQHLDGKNITVTQAMLLSNIASPATIHRKIDELRAAGLIEQVFQGKNRRPIKSSVKLFLFQGLLDILSSTTDQSFCPSSNGLIQMVEQQPKN